MSNATSSAATQPNSMVRGLIVSVFINGFLPFFIYGLLSDSIGTVPALLISGVPPLLDSIYTLIKRGHLDALGAIILSGIVLSILVAFIGGNERILLARESLITGLIGVGFLATLFVLPRPVQFYIARHFATGNDPVKVAEFDGYWKYEGFRFSMRFMTTVWGIGLIVEAVIRISLALTIPIQTFLAVSPFIAYGIWGGLMVWTMWYSARGQRKGEERSRARQENEAEVKIEA